MDTLGALKQRSPQSLMSASFVTAVDSYLTYYASGSSHTARAKQLDLDHFLRFLCEFRGVSSPKKLTLRDWDYSAVQRFIDHRLSIGEAPATVARRLATIKHMGRTFADQLTGFTNPAKDVKPPKKAPPKPKSMTAKQRDQVRKKVRARLKEKNTFIRNRNALLFEMLLDTGLRADEVRLLKRGQIDNELTWIENVRTKGRQYRNVYIATTLRPRIEEYLELRRDALKRFYTTLTKAQSKALPFFLSTYNGVPGDPESFAMGPKTIWRAINEFSSGLDLHPHLLRHTFALDLLEDSNDIRLVSQALGHSDVRITMRYTERTDQNLAKAIERAKDKKK